MSKRLLVIILATLLAGCGAPSEDAREAVDWTPHDLEGEAGELPDGRELVQRMVDFMQPMPELAFEARVTYEAVQESGQKLQFDMLQRVAVRRPDQLSWVTLRDDATSDLAWFDKGQFSFVRQPANVWAQIQTRGGIAELVDELVNDYAVMVPFPDMLSGAARQAWLDVDEDAIWYVGEAWVNGHWTDHVAIRRPGADVQVWIQQGDPFPAKLAIVYTDEESLPSYTARFSKWATSLPADSVFEFTPPEGAERIDVVASSGAGR